MAPEHAGAFTANLTRSVTVETTTGRKQVVQELYLLEDASQSLQLDRLEGSRTYRTWVDFAVRCWAAELTAREFVSTGCFSYREPLGSLAFPLSRWIAHTQKDFTFFALLLPSLRALLVGAYSERDPLVPLTEGERENRSVITGSSSHELLGCGSPKLLGMVWTLKPTRCRTISRVPKIPKFPSHQMCVLGTLLYEDLKP